MCGAGLMIAPGAAVAASVNPGRPAASVAHTDDTARALTRYRYVQIKPVATGVFGRYDEGVDVNDSGRVVGYTSVPQSSHGFIWADGHTTDIGTLGSGATDPVRESQSRAINASGVVVGSSQLDGPGDTGQHAFTWHDRVFTDLGTGYRDHRSGSYANDINDNGLVVGVHYRRQGAPFRAVAWSSGRIISLPGLGGTAGRYGTTSEAVAVNSSGMIVGDALPPQGASHAVLWRNGTVQDLGTLGGASSEAFGVNDRGVVVGQSVTPSGSYHGFRWQNGVMTDLGALPAPGTTGGPSTSADDINAAGVKVGSARITTDGTRETTAVIWNGRRPVDLNTLVDGLPAGRKLELANAISNTGRITGRSCRSSYCGGSTTRAFVLIPVGDTPSSPSRD